MGARYNHDYEAFGRIVLCEMMLPEMAKRGGKVLARAEFTAPFDPNDPDGEHYRDAFSLEVGIREEPTRRAFARISNSDHAALIVEYGNSKTPRHRTLGNALDAAGD